MDRRLSRNTSSRGLPLPLRFGLVGAAACFAGALLGEWLFPAPAAAPVGGPQNIALVIDASGSMDEDGKLHEVRRAAQAFVARQNLGPTRVSVVAFGDHARLLSPPTDDRAALEAALDEVSDGGATDMAAGLEAGARSLEGTNGPRTLLLFTDGEPNTRLEPVMIAKPKTAALALSLRAQGNRIVAVGTEDADMDFLSSVTGTHELVFGTTAGSFGEAFARADRAIRQLFRSPGTAGSGLTAARDAALLGALVALLLGAALLVAENVWSLRGRPWRDLSWVPLGAAALGAVGALLGQGLFAVGLASRAPAWALLGAAVGLLLGLADRSRTKALRGLCGGALGGLIGGVLFDPLAGLRLGAADSGTVARLAAFALLGFFIGLMLRAAQDALRRAWLIGLTTGPYEGKTFELARARVSVGRSDANDLALYRERDLPQRAGTLVLEGDGWTWQGLPIAVNGALRPHAPLRSGDRLRLGATEFEFRVRGQETGVARERWLLAGRRTVALPHPLRRARIGSAAGSEVCLEGLAPSHAELLLEGGELKLRALAGETRLNDRVLPPGHSAPLAAGDLLRLGELELALVRDLG
nr:VWA domain-containing protein [Deinobacterium chartae]